MPKLKGQRAQQGDLDRVAGTSIKKDRTDLTGRDDVTAEEIIRGLTPKKDRKKTAKKGK